jgi:uncharacterized protein DUF4953/uncharacterized protein DUF5117
MKKMTTWIVAGLVLTAGVAFGQPADSRAKTIGERTGGLQKIDGYMPLYWDADGGKMLMEIGRFNTEMLYQLSLPAGVGSNPIGLDRGQLGDSHVVVFQRIGPKVLMVQRNYRYRAVTDDPAERRAVEDSFARSVLWGFKVEAADGDRVLVDATSFFIRDAHGVVDRLRQAKQGRYRMDESRSAFYMDRTRGFPQNTEVETIITFTTDEDPGRLVAQVVPSAQSVTVRQHHSFVQLPDDKYRPRRVDPRVGAFGIEYYDFATPFGRPIEQRFVARHRLEKKDPGAAVSEPVKPIVYYVDNGAPEPIRSALVEGASWWNQAFEAAGFRNAFQVKVLPEDADPMDVRYNMINWVHRSTRGWSYGGSIEDPRTGEIIKGNVTLGSLRIRQDFLIGSGLVPIFGDGSRQGGDGFVTTCEAAMATDDDALAALDPAIDPEAMSLARIRQLSAHEVGHTLGFAHNFAASTYGRASVLDYPAPWVEIKNGKLDLSNAYATGIGDYDKFAVQYSYSQFAPGTNEDEALEKIVEGGVAKGYLFLSDQDARPEGAANPLATLWDNGADAVATLKHEMEVRRIALEQFGLDSVPVGTPLAMLEAKLLPLYLHHRYQLNAAIKTIGGVYYAHSVRTKTGPNPARPVEIIPPAKQKEALAVVLDTLDPEALKVPERILELMPPAAPGFGRGTIELFDKRTDPIFDPLSAASLAADLTVSGLLQHERAARLTTFHARNADNPAFADVVNALLKKVWTRPADAYAQQIARTTQWLVVSRLMDLASNADAMPQVRATAANGLRNIVAGIGAGNDSMKDEIERFLRRPDPANKKTDPLPTPAGDPIGGR